VICALTRDIAVRLYYKYGNGVSFSHVAAAMKKTKKVALMIPATRTDIMQALRGVMDYAAQRGTWTLDMNPEAFAVPLQTLTDWWGDGVLVCLNTESQLRAARTLRVPVVNLSGTLPSGGVPRVTVDQEAVGRLAAEHFLDRGFLRTAYFGQQGVWYSKQRECGFVARITQAGGQCAVLEAPRSFDASHPWYQGMKLLEQWLKTLKPPVGLMAVHDYRARMILEACQRLRLRVPQDIAVIGVDNSEVACEFSQIPLSSVARSDWREGYEAAALLDRLMAGGRPPKHDILIPPEGVITRRSTDGEAIENPHVAAAARLIREHLGEPFGIEVLEQHLAVSRRYLYYHFRRSLNCTPHQYINRVRIERAKQLLAGPGKLKLHNVARTCGFSTIPRLRLVFRRITGMTLAEYRRSLPVGRSTKTPDAAAPAEKTTAPTPSGAGRRTPRRGRRGG
jgi:LacI family transcriptional regulator